MTIEEKAKAYDKFLEEIKSKFKDFQVIIYNKNDLEKFFPELAESENERIKKIIKQKLVDKYKEWYDFIRWFVKQRTDDYTLIPSDDDIHKWGDNILNHARKVLEQNTVEWSDEDEKMLERLIRYFEDEEYFSVEDDVAYSIWLKSLKDIYTWKPSDEQMKALNEVLNFAANHESPHWNDYIFGTLNNLIRQLKKQKE